MSKDYNKVKSDMLGEDYQAAMVHIRRQLLFKYLKKCGENICFRCGQEITNDSELSIDHKKPWMYSQEPAALFKDLENIAFSHRSCNYKDRRQNISRFGELGLKGVRRVARKRGPDKFQASISIQGKMEYIGQFETGEEAGKAFDLKAIEVYGQRAVTNKQLGLL